MEVTQRQEGGGGGGYLKKGPLELTRTPPYPPLEIKIQGPIARSTYEASSHRNSASPRTPYWCMERRIRRTEYGTMQKKQARRLQAKGLNVRCVPSMVALNFTDQCKAFWDAKVIIMVHSGQTANMVCARHGTRVLEFACPVVVGWLQKMTNQHKTMGWNYTYQQVPDCKEKASQWGKGHWKSFITENAFVERWLDQ